jgi:hypothetical protein
MMPSSRITLTASRRSNPRSARAAAPPPGAVEGARLGRSEGRFVEGGEQRVQRVGDVAHRRLPVGQGVLGAAVEASGVAVEARRAALQEHPHTSRYSRQVARRIRARASSAPSSRRTSSAMDWKSRARAVGSKPSSTRACSSRRLPSGSSRKRRPAKRLPARALPLERVEHANGRLGPQHAVGVEGDLLFVAAPRALTRAASAAAAGMLIVTSLALALVSRSATSSASSRALASLSFTRGMRSHPRPRRAPPRKLTARSAAPRRRAPWGHSPAEDQGAAGSPGGGAAAAARRSPR